MAFIRDIFEGREGQRLRQSYGDFGLFAAPQRPVPVVHVKPSYLIAAARRKYGREIYVIGAVEDKLNEFWENVEIKASAFEERPKPVARSIVDITAKEHTNTSDGVDEVKISSNQKETRSEKKSYSLSFEKSWEFGGSINVGASFFNIVGAGGASLGLGGSAKRTTTKTEDSTGQEERSLSQQYGVTGDVKVPPKTAMTMKITTYSVTYKATINAEFTTSRTNMIPISYKSRFAKLFCIGDCSACRSTGFIAAEELFQYETNFNVNEKYVTFTRETDLSYLGETIQMYKTEKPLPK